MKILSTYNNRQILLILLILICIHCLRYHRKCYKNFSNIVQVERAKKRYAEALDEGESLVIKGKAGRPSLSSTQIATERIALRSKSEPYIKEACIICQIVGGNVSKVAYDSTGKAMLEASKKLQDKGFFRRLNHITSAGDGIANDVVYHNNCWARVRSKVHPRKEKNDSISHTLSAIEIINFVQTQMNDPEQSCLDINMVDCMFKEILLENGEANAGQDYKKKLKELILEAIPEAVFVKQKQKNNPELIISQGTQSNTVSSFKTKKWLERAFK